jgi:CheY-like chemotaxis protein
MRILVLDDDKEILDFVGKLLRDEGHEVTASARARAGLLQIDAKRIDVLLTDMLMPEMDGIEVIKALRKNHPDLLIVAMSGGGSRLSADTTLNMSQAFGADRVLYKPFRRNELLAAIQRD